MIQLLMGDCEEFLTLSLTFLPQLSYPHSALSILGLWDSQTLNNFAALVDNKSELSWRRPFLSCFDESAIAKSLGVEFV